MDGRFNKPFVLDRVSFSSSLLESLVLAMSLRVAVKQAIL